MRARARPGERGAVAAFVVLALVALVAFLGIALNVGHLMSVRGELQNGADMAALSGAGVLDGTAGRLTDASAGAQSFGNENETDSQVSLGVKANDVQIGTWSPTTRTFTPLSDPARSAEIVAVKVTTYRNATHNGPVDVFLGSFLGRTQSDVASSSIAVHGGPGQIPCAQMPIAISQCYLDVNRCGQTFTIAFINNNNDTAGWTTFTLVANAHNLINLLDSAINNTCTAIGTDNTVELNNGQVNSACAELNTVWQREGGANHLWIVPVIDTGGCPPTFNKAATVYTFIYIRITAVQCSASPKYVTAKVECGVPAPPDSLPGGPFNQSIPPLPPALVQ